MERKPRKKLNIRKRFFLFVSACLLLVSYFTWKALQPRTVALMQTYNYIRQTAGKGVLVFYEYAPSFLENFPDQELVVEDGQRVRTDDFIAPLEGTSKEAANRALKSLRALSSRSDLSPLHREKVAYNLAYLEKILDRGQLIAPKSSVVRFQTDGYEDLFSPLMIDQMEPGDVLKNEPGPVRQGIKFVDNRLFYLLVDIPQSVHRNDWSVGSRYDLLIDEDTSLEAKLEAVKTDDLNRQLLVFSLRDGFSILDDKRFVSVNVVEEKYTSFILPMTCVYRKGDYYYAQVLDENDVLIEVKLKVLDVFLESGEFVVETGSKESDEPELTLFDRVLLKPDNRKEEESY